MSRASDLQWGRQGGRIGDHRTADELLADINRARINAGADWPTIDGPTRCTTCTTGPHTTETGETWCDRHAPRCTHCHTEHPKLEQINRCWCCPDCALDCWAGLRRMAQARKAAGVLLNHWDRRALGTLAPAKEAV